MPESSQKNNPLRSELLKYAGYLLSRRPYFSSQVRQKLNDKLKKLSENSESDLVEEVLGELKSANYLNDEYLLEGYIRQHLNKLQGPKIIYQKLRYLGLPKDQIEKALKGEDQKVLIEQAKEKASLKYPKLDSFQLKSKLYQRGF